MSISVPWNNGKLTVSENQRFLQHENGTPFFWLGDTAWLISRLTREEAEIYLENRRQQGFNVIQIMAVHTINVENAYGRSPFIDKKFTKPDLSIDENGENSYWDHMDYIVDRAAGKGMYIAMVAVWGTVVTQEKALDAKEALIYGKWLSDRYKDKPNIIWLNGGDEKGSLETETWLNLAHAIRSNDPDHLLSFHPYGRMQSSTWFHDEDWLDFNMFQSGHSRYDQIREDDNPGIWKGEDNWRYVQEDYARVPVKPTLDAEPSYEGVPQGLHDPKEPFWNAEDCRRYAYWSVFAGSCGHTFGHNAIMQMHKPEFGLVGAFGNEKYWDDALGDPGSQQMQHLKNLILSRPYFERIPDQSFLHGDPGFRYEHLLITRGNDYIFVYTYTGRTIELDMDAKTGTNMGIISVTHFKAWWYNPRNGESQFIDTFENKGVLKFAPPDGQKNGNDWVLVLDDASKNYEVPGQIK